LLEKIAFVMHEVVYKPEEIIIQEENAYDEKELFFIFEGKVEVFI
jgi:hypothetical protein